jgi:WD40 repeat protein
MLALDDRRIDAPPRRDFSFDVTLTGAIFLADGTLAVALGDGSVRLVAPGDTGEPDAVQPHCAGAAILAITLDLDGTGVLTSGDDGCVVRTGRDGKTTLLTEFPGRQADVLAVSMVGGLRAATAGREVRLIDRTGRVVATSADHPSTVTGLAFNQKGKRLAVSHYDGVTLWWTGKLGRSPSRLRWRGSHIGMTWSPDGAVIVTATQECELHGWRLADGQHMRMTGYAAKARAMSWLGRPMTLATSGSDCVIAWSFTGTGPMGKPPIQIGREIGELVTSAAVHPKRPIVAAGFDDGQAVVCALGRQDQAIRLRQADGKRIAALAWSPLDGARLAVATESGDVSLFDLSRGAEV